MNNGYQTRIEKAKKAFQEAEYILLGGGAGLSDAADFIIQKARKIKSFNLRLYLFSLDSKKSPGIAAGIVVCFASHLITV